MSSGRKQIEAPAGATEDADRAGPRFRDQLIAVLPRLRRFARGLTGAAADADDALLRCHEPLRPPVRLRSFSLCLPVPRARPDALFPVVASTLPPVPRLRMAKKQAVCAAK